MIIWITGNTESGKTYLANKLSKGQKNVISLDGDKCRNIWPGLGLSVEDRTEQNLRVARLAVELENQNLAVIISVIAPYESLRKKIEEICNPLWIHIDHNIYKDDSNRVYESPDNPILKLYRENIL